MIEGAIYNANIEVQRRTFWETKSTHVRTKASGIWSGWMNYVTIYNYQAPATDDIDSAIKAGLTSVSQTAVFMLRIHIINTAVYLFTVGCESGVYTAYGVEEGSTSNMLQTIIYDPGISYKRSILPST